jgi:hypothetical protein
MKFKINDIEAIKEVVVEAPGFLEALGEYLPWPSLQLAVYYTPHRGRVSATDRKTGFLYAVDIISEKSEKC